VRSFAFYTHLLHFLLWKKKEGAGRDFRTINHSRMFLNIVFVFVKNLFQFLYAQNVLPTGKGINGVDFCCQSFSSAGDRTLEHQTAFGLKSLCHSGQTQTSGGSKSLPRLFHSDLLNNQRRVATPHHWIRKLQTEYHAEILNQTPDSHAAFPRVARIVQKCLQLIEILEFFLHTVERDIKV